MTTSRPILSTFKHAIIYSGAGIIGKAVGFIMLPVYAHLLRSEGYGIIGMIDIVLSVLVLFIGYGISGGMARFYFEKKDEAEKKILVSTTLFLMFILVLAVSLPSLFFSRQIAYLAFGSNEYEFYITLALLTFIASMTSQTAERYLLIKQQSILFSIFSLLKLILALSLNIYLIVYLRMGVLGYLYSGLITAVIGTILLHTNAFLQVGFHFNKNDAVDVTKYSLPLIPGYIMIFIKNNTNRILLRNYMGLAQLGVFEMLFKFVTLIGLFITEPMMKSWGIKQLEICDEENGPEIMAKVFFIQLVVMLFFGLILSLEIPLLLKILTPEEFWISGTVVLLAVASRVLLASYYHFFFGLIYAKKTFKISLTQAYTTIINVAGSLILIKPFGILGAVLVSFFTSLAQCIIGYNMANRYYFIPFNWKKIISTCCIVLTIFFLINSFKLSPNGTFSTWLIKLTAKPIESLMMFAQLDEVKDGKLLTYVVGNIYLIFEGLLKLVLSTSFLVVLSVTNVSLRNRFIGAIKNKSISHLFKF